MTAVDSYFAPITTFEELARRLGVNFRMEVTYWDDVEPPHRNVPWGIVVVWTGAPAHVLSAWQEATIPAGVIPNTKLVVAEAFANTLDEAAMAAWADKALHRAKYAPDKIVRFVYDADAERLIPELGASPCR